MMLFEEFFKKKKINLVALQQEDQGLYSEFKDHYEQMGEKSFDHTKKYWFNKLRRQFPLPVEVKADKLRPENQIAEQTVADTLTEHSTGDKAPDLGNSQESTVITTESTPTAPAPKLGFKPKFKTASAVPPTSTETQEEKVLDDQNAPTSETPAAPVPKVGFKPRFKAGVTNKPTEETSEALVTNKPEPGASVETLENDTSVEPQATPPKIGFKPRFKAGVTNAKSADETPQPVVEKPQEAKPEDLSNPAPAHEPATPAKIGFKPRFKAGVTSTKPVDEASQPVIKTPQEGKPEDLSNQVSAPEPTTPTKIGFKPRFKAGVTSTKPAEEIEKPQEVTKEEPALPVVEPEAEATEPDEAIATKPVYKPRFTPNMIKRKPPEKEGE